MIIKIIETILYLTLIVCLILMAIKSKKRLRQLKEEKRKALKTLEKWDKYTFKVKNFFDKLDEKTKKMEEDLHRKESYEKGICDDIVDKE